MGFGDEPSAQSTPTAEEDAPTGGDPVAVVTEAATPERLVASFGAGRQLRADAEAEAAALAAAERAVVEAEVTTTSVARAATSATTAPAATTPTTAPPTTTAPTTTAPPPPPPTTAAPAPAPPVTSAIWDQIAACESGGNWAINTGNGYYGGLQFSLSSWRGVGGTGYPHEASRETQIAMGERLRANGGWGHWPACSRKLGLR